MSDIAIRILTDEKETDFSSKHGLNVVSKKFVNLPFTVNYPCIVFSTNSKTKYNNKVQPFHIQFISEKIVIDSEIDKSVAYVIELESSED